MKPLPEPRPTNSILVRRPAELSKSIAGAPVISTESIARLRLFLPAIAAEAPTFALIESSVNC